MESMRLRDLVLELLWPSFCQQCQRLGPPLCRNCYNSLEFYFSQLFHQEMQKRFPKVHADQILVCARLSGGLALLLKNFKYHNARNLAPFLALLLHRHLLIPEADYLTFIPLHPRKLRQRGYNQCQEIALTLGKLLRLPVLNLLERPKYLSAQARVKSQQARLERLEGAFTLTAGAKEKISGQRILLLDDVLTTGATLNQAASVLKLAGAREIIGLVVASKAK